MDLSIIIVSWKVKELLKRCMASIYSQKFNFTFELILIDNNSNDGAVEMAREYFPQVKIIANNKNFGFAMASNQGMKIAVGKYFLLLNPDTELIDSSLENAVFEMNNIAEVGILGAKILNFNSSIQHSVRNFPKILDHLAMMFKLHHFFALKKYSIPDFDYSKKQNVDQVMGACFFISRRLTEKIGYLDEKFHLWFEEVDYCKRAKNAGFKVVYFPETQIIHYGGQSFKQIYFKKQWQFSKSRLRYIRKYNNFLSFALILSLTPFSIILSWFNINHGKQNFK